MKAMKKPMDNKVKSLQSYMLIQLLKTFDLECKAMQTQLLNQKIDEQFGKEPFFNEAIKKDFRIEK